MEIPALLGLPTPPDALLVPAALLFGLVMGSFANVLIHRLPDRSEAALEAPDPPLWRSLSQAWRRVAVPRRSGCPRCGSAIQGRDNIPLLSYLLLRGRCRACRAAISLRYPAVELANGSLWAALALIHGASARALVLMLLATVLLVLALIDLELQLLPDALTLPGTALGVAAAGLASAGLFPEWPIGLIAAAGGAGRFGGALPAAAGGYVLFWLVASAWRRLRGVEALGQGDWKMAAMLGAFLGWQKLLLTVFLATLSGSLAGVALMALGRGGGQSPLPLGTFLGLGGLAVLFAGDWLLAWYGGFL